MTTLPAHPRPYVWYVWTNGNVEAKYIILGKQLRTTGTRLKAQVLAPPAG